MKLKTHISLVAMASVTPQEDTSKGEYRIGDGALNMDMPSDANQMLAIKFTLDPAAEVDKPSALYIEPATGQAEVDLANVPAGWTATEFDAWADAEKFGTTVPGLDADGESLDLGTVYSFALLSTGPVEISAAANSGTQWNDMLGANATLTLRDLLITRPDGIAIAADEQIRIENKSATATTITLIVLGKQ